MINPDPAIFITILDHRAALVSQQVEFSQVLDALKAQALEKNASIAELSSFKASVVTAAQDERLGVEAIVGIIADGNASEVDRKRADILRQIAALQALL